jgi:hypothetical protein
MSTGPFYSPGPLANATLDASNIQNFLTQFSAALQGVGWKFIRFISGSSGTTGSVLESVPLIPTGQKMRIRSWYNGGFNGLYSVVNLIATDSTESFIAQNGGITISANKTERIICGPYQFFLLTETMPYFNAPFSVNDYGAGVPVVGITNINPAFWARYSAGGSFGFRCFRDTLVPNNSFGYTFLLNGLFASDLNDSVTIAPQLLTMRSSELQHAIPFFNGNFPVIEPRLVMGQTTGSALTVGLWDAFVYSNPVPTKLVATADNHTWESYTLNADCGTLFLAIGAQAAAGVPGFSY